MRTRVCYRCCRNVVLNSCCFPVFSHRPSAAQLLKDPFFKKAKRPEYIQKTLLTDAPRLKDFGVKVSGKQQQQQQPFFCLIHALMSCCEIESLRFIPIRD